MTRHPSTLEGRVRQVAFATRGLHFSARPTVRELARRFRVTQSQVVDAIEADDDLELVVGCQAGAGGAHGAFATEGDYTLSWIGDDVPTATRAPTTRPGQARRASSVPARFTIPTT